MNEKIEDLLPGASLRPEVDCVRCGARGHAFLVCQQFLCLSCWREWNAFDDWESTCRRMAGWVEQKKASAA